MNIFPHRNPEQAGRSQWTLGSCRLLKRIGVLFAFALVTGCQSMPPLNFNPPNVGLASRKIDAEIKNVIITVARPDEKKGALDFGFQYSQDIPQLWKSALEDALARNVLFSDESQRKVNLTVKILKLDTPAAGISMTTNSIARYELVDRSDGTIYFTSDIAASGTTPADFAFNGGIRAMESLNRAVQNNISSFLQQVETVDISRPIFPGQSNGGNAPAAASQSAAAQRSAGNPASESKHEFQAQKLTRSLGCNSVSMISAASTVETYQATCPDGKVQIIQCEFTNCRVMQ